MNRYILLLLVSSSFYGQNCSMLKDGSYKMIYEGQTENFGEFELRNGSYYTKDQGIEKEYKIEMLDKCTFRIIDTEIIDDSKPTELQKLIGKQHAYFEIIKVEDEIYYFICIVNLHVQCGKGRFIFNKTIKPSHNNW